MLHDAFPVASKRQGMKPDLLPFIDSLINGINRQKDVLVAYPGLLAQINRGTELFRIMLTREQRDLFRQTLRFLRRNDDRRADGIHEHAQLCRVQLPAAIAVCVFVALFGADDVKAIPAEDVNIVADRVPVPAVPACFANIHQLG